MTAPVAARVTPPGYRIFADELTRFAAGRADARVTALAERVAAPLRVAVRGRRGVGCGTVARALGGAGAASGISVRTGPGASPTDDGDVDVVVHVIAEVVKPEDRAAINVAAAAAHPVLAVLNKADLAGRAGDGPIAAARTHCARFAALLGAPLEPISGLLAVAALEDLDAGSWAALRALAAHPGGPTCLDGAAAGFLAAGVPVSADARRSLLGSLDVFGTALAVAALRRGATRAQVRALLRRISGVDAVLNGIAALGARVRYRRVLQAVAELEALAVGRDEAIGGFLSRDDTVVARMAAAVDLAEAAGLEPADRDREDPAAHLSRALRWQQYTRGSVSALHRACGADIARGSLRLWSQARGPLPGEPR